VFNKSLREIGEVSEHEFQAMAEHDDDTKGAKRKREEKKQDDFLKINEVTD